MLTTESAICGAPEGLFPGTLLFSIGINHPPSMCKGTHILTPTLGLRKGVNQLIKLMIGIEICQAYYKLSLEVEKTAQVNLFDSEEKFWKVVHQ